MLFDYLNPRIEDPYVKDELRKWSERLLQGVTVEGHRIESLSNSNEVKILFGHITIKMSDEHAQRLSLDLASLGIEKSLRKR